MARNFDGVDDRIQVTAGSLVGMQYGTYATICRWDISQATSEYVTPLGLYTSTQSTFTCILSKTGASTGIINLLIDGDDMSVAYPNAGTTNWRFICWRKDTGTAACNFWCYEFDGAGWSTDGTSGGTHANSGRTITQIYIGRNPADFNYFKGEIAVVAAWKNFALPTNIIKSLPFSLNNWLAASPTSLHLLDQSSTAMNVRDMVGTNHQSAITGTLVSSFSPPFTYFPASGTRRYRAISSGTSATATPSTVPGTVSFPAPTITTTALVTPTTIAGTASLPTPGLIITASPSTIAATATLPAPTPIIGGSATATPSTIAAAASLPAPTILVDATVLTLTSSDDFTGTDGTAWNSTLWPTTRFISSGTDTASFTIQSNQGRIINVGVAGDFVESYAFSAADYDDFELYFRVQTTTNGNHVIVAGGRYDTNILSGNPAGYMIYADAADWYLVKQAGGGTTTLAGPFTLGSDPTDKQVRMRFKGNRIQAKVFNFGATEPVTWTADVTDSDHTSGRIMLGAWQFDNTLGVTYDNFKVFTGITTIAATASLPTPTIALGPQPTRVLATVSFPTPTISLSPVVTPTRVLSTVSIPSPGISPTIGVTTVAAVATLPTPTITTGTNPAPATIPGTATLPAPTVSLSYTTTPTTIASTVSIPSPTEIITVIPTTVLSTVSFPSPVKAITIFPITVPVTVSIPTPAVSAPGAGIATPGTVVAVVTLPTPTFVTNQLSPATIVAHLTIGVPVITLTRPNPPTVMARLFIPTPFILFTPIGVIHADPGDIATPCICGDTTVISYSPLSNGSDVIVKAPSGRVISTRR